MSRRVPRRTFLFVALASAFLLPMMRSYPASSHAQTSRNQSSDQAAENVEEGTPRDDLQHSIRLDDYTLIAKSGPERGEIIFGYKCWVCHNDYQKEAPPLRGFYKRATLQSGEPLDDHAVEEQIKNGGLGMPSFRTSLSDSDISDVLAYLRLGKCCIEEEPPKNPWYQAAENHWPVPASTSGGPHGRVRISTGESAEGIMVQLIAPNGVRTTVYADEHGSYEFPQMQTGKYTLRIATPLQYKPYVRGSIQFQEKTSFDEIVLDRISPTDLLPPTPEIESQLSGAELLWNLPGTAVEKDNFRKTCGSGGCHSYQQILRNRYDERSWRILVTRMTHHGGGPIFNGDPGGAARKLSDEEEMVVQWLAKVRGVDSKDPPMEAFPRPGISSTRAVITEYELPRLLLSPHDVQGDADGNIWYTSHKSRYVGRLDPRTGIVTEFALPLTPGAAPGTHHAIPQKDGTVWFSENWGHILTKLDPQTGKFKQVPVDSPMRINSPGFGDFAQTPDGIVWDGLQGTGALDKIDPDTGKILARFPIKGGAAYESTVSADGRFWSGASSDIGAGNLAFLFDINSGKMIALDSGSRRSSGKRGAFDPFDNAWFGGVNGTLVELDAKAHSIREFWPPTPFVPYTDFYDAAPDKNGEIWAGTLHAQWFLRFNPKTAAWTAYTMPEPYAHERKAWVDNSTTPVTVWYVDTVTGCLVRIQPMEKI